MCAESQLALRTLVYLAYIDDPDFSANKNQSKASKTQEHEQFQVLGSVLVHDRIFALLEVHFGIYATSRCFSPEGLPIDFEFHAHELFHGTGFFRDWEQAKRFAIFQQCMTAIANLQLPVRYGAVDKAKLAKQIYKSANPLDMSFRMCIEQIQKCLKIIGEAGLLIADNFDDGKKRNLKQTFREYRKKFSSEAAEVMERVQKSGAPGSQIPQNVPISNLLDDMYFGDSRDSVGIQAADMCSFLIRRHLAKKQDSEWLYKLIEPNVAGIVWPD